MSIQEEDVYKKRLWNRENHSFLGQQDENSFNYLELLENRYPNPRYKKLWQNRGINISASFIQQSPLEIDDIRDHDTLNLLLVQSELLKLSGDEFVDLIQKKCSDVQSDQVLKVMRNAACLDITGEYCFFLDNYYNELKEKERRRAKLK